MKKIARLFILGLFGIISTAKAGRQISPFTLQGAWQVKQGDQQYVLQLIDNYCVLVSFDITAKKFYKTWGGPFEYKDGKLLVRHEFNTENPALIGTDQGYPCQLSGKDLQAELTGTNATWRIIDPAGTALSGVWRINGRKQGDEISPIKLGERRTLKVLSGSRFQWIAFNRQTKEFFGTGGGHYTFENGLYTEHIEFFSRDASRVGASLGFDGKLENGTWHHSGLSSRGEAIYETWIHLHP